MTSTNWEKRLLEFQARTNLSKQQKASIESAWQYLMGNGIADDPVGAAEYHYNKAVNLGGL